MSHTTFTLYGPSDAFLEYGVSRCSPLDSQDSCPIFTTVYGDSEDQHITTECGHAFHSACLQTWLEGDQGTWATCPLCRERFFRRPEPFEYDDHPDANELLHDPEGWEGLQLERNQVETTHGTISQHVHHLWSRWCSDGWITDDSLDPGGWSLFVVEALNAYTSSQGEAYARYSAQEFFVIKVIINSLMDCARSEERDVEELEDMMCICDEHGTAAEARLIKQAYERMELDVLFNRVH